jgi:hypothetical protein
VSAVACQWCGASFTPNPLDTGAARYCSPAHKDAANKAARRERKARERELAAVREVTTARSCRCEGEPWVDPHDELETCLRCGHVPAETLGRAA